MELVCFGVRPPPSGNDTDIYISIQTKTINTIKFLVFIKALINTKSFVVLTVYFIYLLCENRR
jgi:hypothetical protein